MSKQECVLCCWENHQFSAHDTEMMRQIQSQHHENAESAKRLSDYYTSNIFKPSLPSLTFAEAMQHLEQHRCDSHPEQPESRWPSIETLESMLAFQEAKMHLLSLKARVAEMEASGKPGDSGSDLTDVKKSLAALEASLHDHANQLL